MADQRARPGAPAPVCTPPGPRGRPADPAAAASRCLSTLRCEWCDVCVTICPDLCITRDPATGAIVFDLDLCKGCGLCAHYCPKGAISMAPDA